MRQLKAIIIDDEMTARESLKLLIDQYCPEITVIGEADDLTTGIEIIDNFSFDLLFMDINLGKHTGFDILDVVRNNKYHLVFLTAYDEFAIKAFKSKALDYLLKPISYTDLRSLISRIQNLENLKTNVSDNSIVLNNYYNLINKKIVIPGKDGSDIISVSDIIYLEGAGSYTNIFISNRKEIFSSRPLKHYETLLIEMPQFVRVHKSFIVNRDYISKIIKSQGGLLVMTNGTTIPISENHKQQVYKMFED